MTITDIRVPTLDTPWPEGSDALALPSTGPAAIEAQVVEMRRSCCSIPTIARETSLTPARVSGILKRVTESILAFTSAADVRAESLLHYEHLLELVMSQIVRPPALAVGGEVEGNSDEPTLDYTAITSALKIIQAKCRLMGAYAVPTIRLDVTAEVKVKDQEGAERTEDFLGQVERFMNFADQIAERGLGSGKKHTDISGEARAAGIWVEGTADAGIVEADVIEEDAEPEIAGRWVAGRFIPEE